jgi:hypothetical protein
MENGLVKAVCKFQMQVFQSFACHATRRLDRWNMNIVMMSAYYLLHLYIKENGVLDVSAAPLVVACIYLSGKVTNYCCVLLVVVYIFYSRMCDSLC